MNKSKHPSKVRPTPNHHSPSYLAKKSLGQNFLTSSVIPNWLCKIGAVTNDDTILEIGPGTGVLTRELLNRGAEVLAIETDNRMIDILKTKFQTELASKKLRLVCGDIRTFNLKDLLPTAPYKVIANIPYYLSGFLLRKMLENNPPPTSLVFLMQKEVVERIAKSKKSSLASLAVAVFGTPKYEKTVSRSHFSPSPKVDSAILSIKNISHDKLPSEQSINTFFALLHTGFASKRKQLAVNLQPYLHKKQTVKFLNENSLPVTARAEDLNISMWLALHQFYLSTVSHY